MVAPVPESYDRYDVMGVIKVDSASTVDGSTSIYEVHYRHSEQLIKTLDEIHSKTGGGYSMGIDQCDGEPCIRITLDKDAPELSEKIPRQLEGYKVGVVILDR